MAADGEEAPPEAEFIDISIEQDGSLLKKILKEGWTDGGKPAETNDVLIHYTAKLHADGTKFDASMDRGVKQFQFQIGSGASDGSSKFAITRAFEVGVASMHKREKCILIAQPNYGYGSRGSPPKVPKDAVLEFEVEIFAWQEHVWEPDEMNSDAARSAHALKHKEQGNEEIKAKEWRAALKKYAVGIKFVEYSGGGKLQGEDDQEGGFRMCDIGDGAKLSPDDKKLYVALLNNSAMCLLKMDGGLPAGAIELCNKALAVEPTNVKVLYRRAQAYFEKGEWELVIEATERILGLDGANTEAQKMRQDAIAKKDASKKNQRAVYGKMFGVT